MSKTEKIINILKQMKVNDVLDLILILDIPLQYTIFQRSKVGKSWF